MSTDGDIDVTIPGNSGSVETAAQWMDRLRDDANTASELHNKIFVSDATGGEIAKALASYSAPLRDASHDVYQRARDSADVMHSFAKQLKWRKEDMKEHLETARSDGLKVDGNIIKCPSEVEQPGDFPWRGTWEAQTEWNAKDAAYDEYVRKLRDFKKIRGRVQATFQELNDWIVNNLVAAKEAALKSLYGNVIKTFTENTLGAAVADGGAYENVYRNAASDLRTTAANLANSRSAASSAATRSKPPSQKDIEKALKRSKASAMERAAEDIESAGSGVKKIYWKDCGRRWPDSRFGYGNSRRRSGGVDRRGYRRSCHASRGGRCRGSDHRRHCCGCRCRLGLQPHGSTEVSRTDQPPLGRSERWSVEGSGRRDELGTGYRGLREGWGG